MTDYPDRNLLANAISPYLLQHRNNPVHWREWGPAAFAEAESIGKPILLSIGYAACHWCHVMAHESFEDAETAALMNRYFVNIKVDREERPDVDQVYMTALQAMGEQGGWPLTLFLTSKREPFWGGTYFPPTTQYGRPGFKDVLIAIAQLHEDDPHRVAGNADAIKRRLDHALLTHAQPVRPDIAAVDAIATRLHSAVDPANGGIGSAPKFPSATMWECLWRGWLRRRDPAFRDAAIAWIQALCRGGIYDHLGGGLHRYTVDARWLVPHFEKMLYDNAQFIRALCLCHRDSPRDLFRQRIEQTVGFLLTDMRLPDGGFISSFDADSDGAEGAFYVWTRAEIDAVLGTDAAIFRAAYDVTEDGNWEGKVILNRLIGDQQDTVEHGALLSRCRQRLLKHRAERTAPSRDEKVLADWNGLAIRALAEAAVTCHRPDWLTAAQQAFAFITTSVSRDGRLAHAWRDGRIAGPALATDLAAMTNAAVTLYASTLDETFLAHARTFIATLEDSHSDGNGSYFLAPASRADLLVHARNDHDEAIPSATAMIIEALSRLSLVTDDPELATRADRSLCAAWGRIRDNPYTAVGIANAADTVMRGAKLITTGPGNAYADTTLRHADPARIDLHVADASGARGLIGNIPDLSDNTTPREAAYLCRDMACLPPVFDAAELDHMLSKPTSR